MKKLFLMVSAVVLLSAACNRQADTKPVQTAITPTQNQTQTPSANNSADWKIGSENTVLVFTKNINTLGYGDNINIALAQLTFNAQAKVKAGLPDATLSGLAFGLATFVHIQEAPDKGTSIINSDKLSDGTIKVVSQWNYSGGASTKLAFILVLENNQWKIDRVETIANQNPNPNLKTYTNIQYGFELILTDAWKGYKVFSSVGGQGVGAPTYIDFSLPTADKSRNVINVSDNIYGYASPLTITVIAKDRSYQGTGVKITEDKENVYYYSINKNLPKDLQGLDFEISKIISTFKFTK